VPFHRFVFWIHNEMPLRPILPIYECCSVLSRVFFLLVKLVLHVFYGFLFLVADVIVFDEIVYRFSSWAGDILTRQGEV